MKGTSFLAIVQYGFKGRPKLDQMELKEGDPVKEEIFHKCGKIKIERPKD